jgi:hypothetical protein
MGDDGGTIRRMLQLYFGLFKPLFKTLFSDEVREDPNKGLKQKIIKDILFTASDGQFLTGK